MAARRWRTGPLLCWALTTLCIASAPAAHAHPGATAELRDLSTRVDADPKNIKLRIRYAEAALRAGHLHEARAQAQTIALIDPEEREVHRIRGEVWLGRDRPKAAERELTTYLADGVANAGSGRAYTS